MRKHGLTSIAIGLVLFRLALLQIKPASPRRDDLYLGCLMRHQSAQPARRIVSAGQYFRRAHQPDELARHRRRRVWLRRQAGRTMPSHWRDTALTV